MRQSMKGKLPSLILAGLALVPLGAGLMIANDTGSKASDSAIPAVRPLTEIAKQLEPSVVSIRVEKRAQAQPLGDAFPFGDQIPGFPRFRLPEQQPRQGMGSGFIVSEDGYILTNTHVVDGADKVEVVLSDRREEAAEVVGIDAQTDVAVLKIDAEDLVPVRLGDSTRIEVAETVLAFGSPFGLTQTVTSGIVSAIGRAGVGINDYEDFIQTDADINPGNSGGPLVNARGEVIGINTAIFSRSGGSNGIGFAIPINMAKQVMRGLIEHGEVARGFLGVTIQDLDEGLAKSFGLEQTTGVLVSDVVAGGPAAEAGLESGDVIVRVGQREVYGAAELRQVVASLAPGTEVEVEVLRDGQSIEKTVTLGKLDGQARAAARPADVELGMKLGDAAEHRAGDTGARILEVAPGGPAARAGLRPGDVILAVADQRIEDAGDFQREIARHDLGEGVRLQIERQGTRLFVFLRRTS